MIFRGGMEGMEGMGEAALASSDIAIGLDRRLSERHYGVRSLSFPSAPVVR